MRPAEKRVVDRVDGDWLLDVLTELVAIPSLGGAESPAQEYVAHLLRDMGLDVDVWPLDLDALARHPSFGVEVERAEALGVVGQIGRGDGPTLLLNGHVDVVPVGNLERWQRSPWQATVIEHDAGRRVHGRGALDMKGGLGCALAATRALVEAGVTPRGKLIIQSVVGEEDGGVGTLGAIDRGYRGDGAVIMEPTNLRIITASAGALNVRLTVFGRAAHGCVRDEGISAVELFERLHRGLRELEATRNDAFVDPRFEGYALPIPLSFGVVRAGDWASTVPERLIAEGRFGIGVGEVPETARRAFEEAVNDVVEGDELLREMARTLPPTVEWWGGQFASAEVSEDEPVVAALRGAAADVIGEAPAIGGVPYGSDMRLLCNDGGTPAVLFGPGDVRLAHGPNEAVPVEQLVACARTLALLVLRFCG